MGPCPSDAQRADALARHVRLVESEYRLEWMDDPWTDVGDAGDWLLDLERALAPDVVHLNGYCHGALPWRAPALSVAHSCVLSWWRAVHGAPAPPTWDVYRRLVCLGLHAAALVMAPTAAMRSALVREYGPIERMRVIANGRAAAACAAIREPIVFAAGRVWDAGKNLRALCTVQPEVGWPVCVAGETREEAGPVPADADVQYLGRIPPAEVRDWCARAAIYALPARYEPFGLSVLEAAQAGCALVLGDIPSLRENWTDAALFVDPDDRGALAAALRRLRDDEPLRDDLGRRARQRSRRFTVERMTDAYAATYADMLSGRPATAPALHSSAAITD